MQVTCTLGAEEMCHNFQAPAKVRQLREHVNAYCLLYYQLAPPIFNNLFPSRLTDRDLELLIF